MDFQQRLRDALARHLGAPDLEVTGLRRHTEGFSLETVSFEASWRDPEGRPCRRRLVLRREPEAGVLEPYDLAPQVAAMRAVAGRVAVPEILLLETDPDVLERSFYVMDFVDGDVPLPTPRPDGTPPIADREERAGLAREFAANLAALHSFDWRAAELPGFAAPSDAAEAARAQLDFWCATIEAARPEPLPMLVRAIRELERTVPRGGSLALVHGDYRTGNFLRSGTRITAILDWEMVHIGDPAEDVAWATSRLWRGQTDMPGLLVERERLLALYAEAGGAALDEARLRFYDLLAAVKMTAIMLTGLRAFEERRTDDLRMAIFHHQLSGMHMILAESLGLVGSLTTVESC